MEQKRARYPLGVQDFENMIMGGYTYVDKTEYVYRLTHSDSSCIFLSRPRRFGKSLLVSTLRCYFEGRKELFKGLAIEKLEKEWTQHPVIHISLASAKHLDLEALKRNLLDIISDNAKRLGVNVDAVDPNVALKHLTIRLYEKYKQKVALLIDEYDAPLLDVMHEDEQLKMIRKVVRSLYSPIKDLEPYLRFVFLTGITKFSQMSIFSELNNIFNISMLPDYAGICGITEEEMLTQLDDGIRALAQAKGMTHNETVAALKEQYDGYHFAWPSPDIYNPFSLVNALSVKAIDFYWYAGTPAYLVEMLRKFHVMPAQLGRPSRAEATDFDAPTERLHDITPLLYQSGYLTIKDCVMPAGIYTLDIPNKEIRIGLMKGLMPNYLGAETKNANLTVALMQEALLQGDVDETFRLLKEFLGTVPYVGKTDDTQFHEPHWQQMLYIIFSLMGARCDVEVHTSDGRVDLVARTGTHLYLIELKLNKSAEAAMNQIDLKHYDKRFAQCGLPIVKVGLNFDLPTHNITTWTVERQ